MCSPSTNNETLLFFMMPALWNINTKWCHWPSCVSSGHQNLTVLSLTVWSCSDSPPLPKEDIEISIQKLIKFTKTKNTRSSLSLYYNLCLSLDKRPSFKFFFLFFHKDATAVFPGQTKHCHIKRNDPLRTQKVQPLNQNKKKSLTLRLNYVIISWIRNNYQHIW